MLLQFKRANGTEIYINALQVVAVEPSANTIKRLKYVHMTDKRMIEILDEDNRAVDDLNRGMATTHAGNKDYR